MDIIKNNKEGLYLNTSLDEVNFSKARFSLLLDEKSYIAKKDDKGNFTQFDPYYFTGTKTIGDKVYFEGNPFDGKILYNIEDKNFFAIIECYENALKEKFHLPCVGPKGIIYTEDEILFLNEKLFSKCISNMGKDAYQKDVEPYTNTSFQGEDRLHFTQGVYSYIALTGDEPYNYKDENVSLYDKNFIPLEYKINGINKKLSKTINDYLTEGHSDLELNMEDLHKEITTKERETEISQEEFERQRDKFMKKKNRKICRLKSLSKNRLKIVISLIALTFITVFTLIRINEQNAKPTVIGLSSKETVKVFYEGLHHMNTDYMIASAEECPEAQSYISRIPQIFVTGQMKGIFNPQSGMSTPENWMFFEPDSTRSYSHSIYGLTNFSIDGEESTLNQEVPTRKNHPVQLTYVNKSRLTRESKASHKVHYYLVHTVDEAIQIDEFNTEVTLKWFDNKWQIIRLKENYTSEAISPLPYSLDLKDALPKYNMDVVKSVNSLRQKYYWIPTIESLEEEQKRLDGLGY